ncbi:variable surface protein, partial [Plasmodium gonderi]
LGIILPVLDRIDSTTKHILPIPVGYKQTGGRWFREYKSVLSASGIPAAVEKKEKMFSNLYYDFNKDMYRKRFYYANI